MDQDSSRAPPQKEGRHQVMTSDDRELMIEWLSLANVGRDYCENLSDEELERIYNLNVPQRDE
ncbi:BH0509 family protein [Bacillus sp. FSL W8-1141]|uniref:BH0509 family protein n=1 Tax=Bacillus sp. FSL W8-1141 TaxID=2954646 RepID=UPI0031592F06